MESNVISLSMSVPDIRKIVGRDPQDFVLLVSLAQAGQIPAAETRFGNFMISRKDLPLITAIFNDFRSK